MNDATGCAAVTRKSRMNLRGYRAVIYMERISMCVCINMMFMVHFVLSLI